MKNRIVIKSRCGGRLGLMPALLGSLLAGGWWATARLQAETGSTTMPTIEGSYLLEKMPLPLPADGSAASRALGFCMGGISDLCVAPGGLDGGKSLFGITDRGPNGFVKRPTADGTPMRTLPVPEFSPLVVRLVLEPPPVAGQPGVLRVTEILPITTAAGKPSSGRPAVGPPLGKVMVDPATALALPVDPDGLDSEGIAPTADGGFWVAEEYAPSLVRISAAGQMIRRIVPAGSTLEEGAGCEVLKLLPADYLRRQDNRGFESLATSPDGSRLFAMLQSPLQPLPGTATAKPQSLLVPLLVVDATTGAPLAEYAYPLGASGEKVAAVVAADGKISAIAATGPDTLLVLEQSDSASRLYEIDLHNGSDTLPPTAPHSATPLTKKLVADLADLAPQFNQTLNRGAQGPPRKLSDLKFEGLAILAPGVVALVNDNDFDMDSAGAAPAEPPLRQTCLWVLRLPAVAD
ncbi:esterase-like activity of phytase family protein [bacterium]|nr:MAG: esterase-like activity of phytase family protein [bacterium]